MRETGRGGYQTYLIKTISRLYPNSLILKTDPNYIQGLPDLLILEGERWAALEVKRSAGARHRPNQDWYVDRLNEMSFATFAYPENEREVLDALQRTFSPRGLPRISERE